MDAPSRLFGLKLKRLNTVDKKPVVGIPVELASGEEWRLVGCYAVWFM
jgi:hypothetical protein